MDEWLDGLTQWLAVHPQYLTATLLITSFSECLAILGLLIPGTLALFTLGALAGHTEYSATETLMWGFLGGLLGDIASYKLGRRYHQGIRQFPILRQRPEWLALAEQYLQRYGVMALLVGRFIGAVRPFLPMTAGMLDMPFQRFLLVSIPASLGWAAVYLLPGWVTGSALRLALPEHFWHQTAWVVGGLTLVIGLFFYTHIRSTAHKTLWRLAACAGSLTLLSITWPRLAAFDQGLMQLAQSNRTSWLDHSMSALTQLGNAEVQFCVGGLIVLTLLVKRYRAQAGLVATTLLGTALLCTGLKHLINRDRPEILLHPLSSSSYPSAHTSAMVALCLTLSLLASSQKVLRIQCAWLVFGMLPALLIAGSRLYLGVHWPTDILAGALVAALVCTASLGLFKYANQPITAVSTRTNLTLWGLCATVFLIYAALHYPESYIHYQHN